MSFGSELRALSHRPIIRCLALVILFTISTRFEPLSSTVLDPDIWWHIRGGEAIWTQHAFPHYGVFSQHAERSWVEYSWGFEVIAARVYHAYGLVGLVWLRSILEVMITATLFLMLWRGLGSFWIAWPLTGAGMWAIHHSLALQPMLISILMFTLELAILFEAQRRKSVRLLWLLPPLLVLWANFHIQFIYGIVALVLLAASRIGETVLGEHFEFARANRSDLAWKPLLAISGLGILAPLVSPYSWRLYSVLVGYMTSRVPYAVIVELQALNFRSAGHYVVVLIFTAAFFALGWRRSRDPFQVTLLIICTLVGLRMTRDSWLACLPALAIIANREQEAGENGHAWQFPSLGFAVATAVLTVLMLLVVAWDSKTDNDSLTRAVASSYPVEASEFIRTHSLPGPIYNEMNWGGYLILSLPDRPVAIDNRTDLYGDELLSRFYLVQRGSLDWKMDPDLNASRLVLLYRQSQLAAMLSRDESFQLVYEDPIAVVYTHNTPLPSISQQYKPEASGSPLR